MTFHDFLETKKSLLAGSEHRSLLAIDSSTQLASVALSYDGNLIFSEECLRQKSHSEWINGAIQRAVESCAQGWEGLDVVAVSHGPGSFTGVRVATNVAKTIGYTQNKPIVTYSSLEVLAHQCEAHSDTDLVLPVINAFKNMVFCALFRRRWDGMVDMLLEPKAVEIEKLNDWLRDSPFGSPEMKVQVLGDGFAAYKSYLDPDHNSHVIRVAQPKDHPLASTLVSICLHHWNKDQIKHWRQVMPTYLRASAAEENKGHH